MISYIMKKIIGSQNEREIKKLQSVVANINELESKLAKLPTSELRNKTEQLKATIKSKLNGQEDLEEEDYYKRFEDVLWEVLPEAFAVVREASRRTLGMRPFDVQLIGAIVLHHGKIAEMKTGEGKTLVAALPI
ncbi:MAG: SecA cross-linking domain protein, partial [Thermodesulfobacteriota bacterium]